MGRRACGRVQKDEAGQSDVERGQVSYQVALSSKMLIIIMIMIIKIMIAVIMVMMLMKIIKLT